MQLLSVASVVVVVLGRSMFSAADDDVIGEIMQSGQAFLCVEMNNPDERIKLRELEGINGLRINHCICS
jgi:hypothetical protein